MTRNRYLDALRGLAILRVYLHHALWIGWLAVVYPSIGVMFAVAGSLAAASLDRTPATRVVRSRLRRLLPPLWVFAAVAVPLMLLHGWLTDAQAPLSWSGLLLWVAPVANPPASTWGLPLALGLWYLRTYLWFVLLAPATWWLFRRWPLPTLAAPLVLAVALALPWVNVPANRYTDVLTGFASYGACWLLGYARHNRLLDKISGVTSVVLAIGACATAFTWSVLHGHGFFGIPDDPLSNTLWTTGYVLPLMRARPTMAWLNRVPWLARLIGGVNARAVTIYLWHLPALYAAAGLVALAGLDLDNNHELALALAIGTPLTIAAVLAVGWVEDLAARRQPSLLPATGVASPAAADPRPPASRSPARTDLVAVEASPYRSAGGTAILTTRAGREPRSVGSSGWTMATAAARARRDG